MHSFAASAPLFGPGDILTLIYYFNPTYDNPGADLLVARALVQNKIMAKNESQFKPVDFPFTFDELVTGQIVGQLDLEMCIQLLKAISTLGTRKARKRVIDAVKMLGWAPTPTSPI
jgi:hypothetical protein